jgi:hypothetical protein
MATPPYLGISPLLGYQLGYELVGRRGEEEAQRKQLQDLQALLQQLRPTTTLGPQTTEEPTGRYQVGPSIGETTPSMVSPPTGLSDTLTAHGWGQGPLEYPIPGPGYLTQSAPSRATWGEEALRPQGGPPWVPPPPSQVWPGRPDLERPGFRPGGGFWPGQDIPRIDFPPAQEAIGGATAYQPPDIVIPPSVREVSPGPLIPSPAPAPETYPRREPIERVPVLGLETAPVTRMVPTTVPGRDLLDVIATTTNPKLLEVLKANPWLLNLIAQERERQEWEDVGPTVGPAAPSAAPAGVTTPAPPAAAPPGAATAPPEEAPPSAAPEITALKTRLQPSIAKMVRKPQLFGTARGKALMDQFLKLEEAEGKAEERAGKAQERRLKAATAEEEQDFRQWALEQAQARQAAGDQQGAEDYILMSRKPELGAQVMKERRERAEADARQRFFTGLAEKEPDPDRKALFEAAAVSKGVGEEVMKILKPGEEKAASDFVYKSIARSETGIDPRTGKPASPELRQAAKDYEQKGFQQALDVAQAGYLARQKADLQEKIGKDAPQFADADGVRPSPDMPKAEVYKNYSAVDQRERQFLQSYAQVGRLFREDPQQYKELFPYDDKPGGPRLNNAHQRMILEGFATPSAIAGIAKEFGLTPLSMADIKRLYPLVTKLGFFRTQGAQLARISGDAGAISNADRELMAEAFTSPTTLGGLTAQMKNFRDMLDRGRAQILDKGRVGGPSAPPPPPAVGQSITTPDGTTIKRVE